MSGSETSNRVQKRVAVVMPVFNDWESLTRLLADLDKAIAALPHVFDVIVVDDGSLNPLVPEIPALNTLNSVRLVRLETNVGHQRAIAVGLVHVHAELDADTVAIMDSDGEDTPGELIRLLKQSEEKSAIAIVAQRKTRSETFRFRLFYRLYTAIFRMLTGKRINFGNFMVLPRDYVGRLVFQPNIWNSIAASLVQSRLPVHYMPTARGVRYAGESKMNFVDLVAHGLGTISVFGDVVFVRTLIASLCVLGLASIGAVTVVYLRFLTDLAIPGWATNALGFLVLVSVQAALLPVFMTFLVLGNRSIIQPLPKDRAMQLIGEIVRLHPGQPGGAE